jgi:hypothetical protein
MLMKGGPLMDRESPLRHRHRAMALVSNRIVFVGATITGVAMGTCLGLLVAVVGSLKAHR